MTFFWVLWWFDAIVACIALYFFFVGLGDGTVSSFNGGLWSLLLLGLAVILFGSQWLHAHGHPTLAMLLLAVLAVPAFFYLLIIVIAVIGGERWN
ncbi:MAG: osmoprotectant transporter permease [Saprospiraceae bacterium]